MLMLKRILSFTWRKVQVPGSCHALLERCAQFHPLTVLQPFSNFSPRPYLRQNSSTSLVQKRTSSLIWESAFETVSVSSVHRRHPAPDFPLRCHHDAQAGGRGLSAHDILPEHEVAGLIKFFLGECNGGWRRNRGHHHEERSAPDHEHALPLLLRRGPTPSRPPVRSPACSTFSSRLGG